MCSSEGCHGRIDSWDFERKKAWKINLELKNFFGRMSLKRKPKFHPHLHYVNLFQVSYNKFCNKMNMKPKLPPKSFFPRSFNCQITFSSNTNINNLKSDSEISPLKSFCVRKKKPQALYVVVRICSVKYTYIDNEHFPLLKWFSHALITHNSSPITSLASCYSPTSPSFDLWQ